MVWRNWERFSGGEGIQTVFEHLVGSVMIEKKRVRAKGLRREGVGRDFMQVDAPVCSPSCRAQRIRLSQSERIQGKWILVLARQLLRYAILGQSFHLPVPPFPHLSNRNNNIWPPASRGCFGGPIE